VNAGSSTSATPAWRTRTSLGAAGQRGNSSRSRNCSEQAGRQRFARSRYAYAASRDLVARREKLSASISEVEGQLIVAREALAESFGEAKRYEIAAAIERSVIALRSSDGTASRKMKSRCKSIAAAPTSAADPARGAFSPANIAPRETGPLLAGALTSVVYQRLGFPAWR